MIIRFGKSSRQKNHADRIGGTLFPVKLAVYFKVVRHLEIIIKIIHKRIIAVLPSGANTSRALTAI